MGVIRELVTARRVLAAKQAAYNRSENVERARRLKQKGYSNVAIARELHVSESTARGLLKEKTD